MENKIVVNHGRGIFELSTLALGLLSERKNKDFSKTSEFLNAYPRTDKDLIEVVELLGDRANGSISTNLVIEEVTPSNTYEEGDKVYLACSVYVKSDYGRVTLVAPDGTMITVSDTFIKPCD